MTTTNKMLFKDGIETNIVKLAKANKRNTPPATTRVLSV